MKPCKTLQFDKSLKTPLEHSYKNPSSISPLTVWPNVCIQLMVSRSKTSCHYLKPSTLQFFYCTNLWPNLLSRGYPSVEHKFSCNSICHPVKMWYDSTCWQAVYYWKATDNTRNDFKYICKNINKTFQSRILFVIFSTKDVEIWNVIWTDCSTPDSFSPLISGFSPQYSSVYQALKDRRLLD